MAVLNIAFFLLHTLWIVFICAGWAWRRMRRWHLAAVVLTASSWFVLGAWYGWGYCPCTDWHWGIRARLGYHDPPSYTQLLMMELTGIDVTSGRADAITGLVFAVAALLSLSLNGRDFLIARRASRTSGP